jgi:hypothetical protein
LTRFSFYWWQKRTNLEERSEDTGCSSRLIMTSLAAKVELEDDEHCWGGSMSDYRDLVVEAAWRKS